MIQQGPLLSQSKVCLYLEHTGYVASVTTTSGGLHVELSGTPSHTATPPNFERCVFCIHAVNRWQPDNDGPSDTSSGGRPNIHYGDMVELRHAYSEKWLCMLTKAKSEKESSSLLTGLVGFEDMNNDTIFRFKLLPKYKVRFEGESVQINDQVVLVPDNDDGRRLHAVESSPGPNGELELNCAFSSNCSNTTSAFMVQIYDSCEKEPKALRLGIPISLFHAEAEAFLTSSNSCGKFDSDGQKLRKSIAQLLNVCNRHYQCGA